MKNIRALRKHAAVWMFAISAVLFFPETLFAQGDVIGYLWGGNNLTSEQLEKLTHVMAVDLYFDANGDVFSNPGIDYFQDPNINDFQSWLDDLVERAHAKGVKVSIVIGGENEDFASATSATAYAGTTRRQNLVNNIVNFVDEYDLDGVDIDWEFPNNTATVYTEWYQYVAFLQQLKLELPSKRISVALFPYAPWWWFDTPFIDIPAQIWNTVDAIHLMTYDQNQSTWEWEWKWPDANHSDAAKANAAIDAWAEWGTSDGRNLDKGKLVPGCAFYGYNMDNGNIIFFTYSNGVRRVAKIAYKSGLTCDNPGDTPASVVAKVNHSYDKGYGGVMIWELGYDASTASTDPPPLLNAIWDATSAKIITIDAQPAATTTVIQGHISGNLSVAASTASSMGLSYQWYSSTANSNTGNTITLIQGATNAGFPIPTGLAVGTYYYFCEVKSGSYAVRSDVARVAVTPPPTIAGPSTVCYNGSTFILNNPPTGIITWSVTGPFTVSGSGATVTVTRTGTSTGGGILIAVLNRVIIASKVITPCPPLTITGPSQSCETLVNFSINNLPSNVSGSDIVWSSSASWFQPQNGNTGTGKQFKVTGNNGGNAVYVYAQIGGEILQTSISLSPYPKPFTYHYISDVSVGQTVQLQPPSSWGITDWRWDMDTHPSTYLGSQYGLSANVIFYMEGNHTVLAYPVNSLCGNAYPTLPPSHVYMIGVGNSSSSSVAATYPNPARDILTVDLDAAVRSRSMQQTVTAAVPLTSAADYDVRLYDGQGNLLRSAKTKGGTVQFNVQNLPNGIYYMHIYDATSSKTDIQQIVVEH